MRRLLPDPSKFHPRRIRKIPFFRIFYSGTFLVTTIVLIALLMVTPGDHIYQSFRRNQIYHIIIVAGVYVLTFLVALFIYASRMFKTRSALAAIPKEISVSDGMSIEGSTWMSPKTLMASKLKRRKEMILGVKMKPRVQAVIRKGLNRSAIIAYEGRPRDLSKSPSTYLQIPPTRIKREGTDASHIRGSIEPTEHAPEIEPIWGFISHPGWSSPSSSDLPNLQYDLVIAELPNLIEARAVSLAPPDPLGSSPPTPRVDHADGSPTNNSNPPPLDPVAVEHLRRHISMSMRDYISHLSNLGVLDMPELSDEFLNLYERARFSGTPLDEAQFRTLTNLFAEILRQMRPVEEDVLEQLRESAEEASDVGAASARSVVEDMGKAIRELDGQEDDTGSIIINAINATPTSTPRRGLGRETELGLGTDVQSIHSPDTIIQHLPQQSNRQNSHLSAITTPRPHHTFRQASSSYPFPTSPSHSVSPSRSPRPTLESRGSRRKKTVAKEEQSPPSTSTSTSISTSASISGSSSSIAPRSRARNPLNLCQTEVNNMIDNSSSSNNNDLTVNDDDTDSVIHFSDARVSLDLPYANNTSTTTPR